MKILSLLTLGGLLITGAAQASIFSDAKDAFLLANKLRIDDASVAGRYSCKHVELRSPDEWRDEGLPMKVELNGTDLSFQTDDEVLSIKVNSDMDVVVSDSEGDASVARRSTARELIFQHDQPGEEAIILCKK